MARLQDLLFTQTVKKHKMGVRNFCSFVLPLFFREGRGRGGEVSENHACSAAGGRLWSVHGQDSELCHHNYLRINKPSEPLLAQLTAASHVTSSTRLPVPDPSFSLSITSRNSLIVHTALEQKASPLSPTATRQSLHCLLPDLI